MTDDLPAGFRLLGPISRPIDALAPLYVREGTDGYPTIGFRVGEQHTNVRGNCHGGCWASIADVLVGLSVGVITGMTGPTISMSLDFTGPAT